jgi:hypothetical protein
MTIENTMEGRPKIFTAFMIPVLKATHRTVRIQTAEAATPDSYEDAKL